MSVHYSTVDDAITHIKEVGVSAYLAKTDIKSAFRIVPIHPDDHHLLGMKWKDRYYYNTTLAMGCSMSCAIFEATTVQWIAINKLHIPWMVQVLDDFLPLHLTNFCEECGIPIALEKTEGPNQTLAFLGIILDVSRSLSVLQEENF